MAFREVSGLHLMELLDLAALYFRALGLSGALDEGQSRRMLDAGLMFAGTPNEVYEQIAGYADAIGGLGNLMIMGQAGHVDHDETVDTLRLFGTEVLPRVKELYPAQMAA